MLSKARVRGLATQVAVQTETAWEIHLSAFATNTVTRQTAAVKTSQYRVPVGRWARGVCATCVRVGTALGVCYLGGDV